jgi:large subunit ribosomal protein L25
MVALSTGGRRTLEAEIRQPVGGRHVVRLRRAGKLPGVVYGLGRETVAISMPANQVDQVVHSGAHLVDLHVAGQTEHVLIQQVQYDHLQSNITHVDFLRIDPTQKVRVKVPLEFRGTPKGAKEGGILETQIAELELEVLPLEIPDVIRVHVEHLEMHGIVHAREIALPSGARLINPADQIVCQVRIVKEVEAVVEAPAGPTEPEVIGRKAAEEGSEAETAESAAGSKGQAAGAKAPASGAKAPAAGAKPAPGAKAATPKK